MSDIPESIMRLNKKLGRPVPVGTVMTPAASATPSHVPNHMTDTQLKTQVIRPFPERQIVNVG